MSLETEISNLSQLMAVNNALLEKMLTVVAVTATAPEAPAAAPAVPESSAPSQEGAVPASAAAGVPTAEPEVAKPRRGRPPRTPAAPAASITAPGPTAAAVVATPAGMPETTIDDVKAAIIRLGTAVNRARAEALLGDFQVSDIYKLKPSQYADVIDMANKLVAAAKKP